MNQQLPSSENQTENKATQWVQLIIVVTIAIILAYVVISFLFKFIWWILSLLGFLALIINHRLVRSIISKIIAYYKKSVGLGVGATIGSVVLFTPFVGFLLLKTIWDFRNSNLLSKNKKSLQKELRDLDSEIKDIDFTEE